MAMLTARLLVVFLCSSVSLFCEFRPVLGVCEEPNFVGTACLNENLAYNQSIRANFDVVAGSENLEKAVDGKPGTCFLESDGSSNRPVTSVDVSQKSLADVVTVLLDATLVNNGGIAKANQIKVTVYKDDGSQETPVANPDHMLIAYHLSQAANVSRVDVRSDGNGARLALCEIQVLTVCPSGTYGVECAKNCSAACVDDVCGRLSGYCTDGCKSDMDVPECRKTCKQGLYGDQCKQHCSKTCAEDVCDETSGHCLQGCKEGWTGDRCSAREVPTGGGAGIKASVLLAIAAAVSTLLQYC
ncbi:uncharacterized protein [Littorina saxatilis]|uniref:uncharacterized protein n=1 Tax=Littorina saxatilis TaxID=31220 RepID=UPI0038B4F7E8